MIYLTIVIGRDGKIYNLANGEHPTYSYNKKNATIDNTEKLPKNAFTCSEEEYKRMIK